MRLFIALELPAEVIAVLEGMQRRLQRSGDHPVKWVASTGMHLTLQFLGEVEEQRVADMLTVLKSIRVADTHQSSAAHLQTTGAGAFPTLRQPQTLWVGVSGAVEPLAELQQRLSQALEPLGFEPETRPFRAHLTLGRVRRDATPAQKRALGAAIENLPAVQAVTWPMGQPVLFQSTLTREGARYTRIDDEY